MCSLHKTHLKVVAVMWQNVKEFNATYWLWVNWWRAVAVQPSVSPAGRLSEETPYALERRIFWNLGSATLSIKTPAAYRSLLRVLLIASFDLKVKHTSRSCRLSMLEFFILFCFWGLHMMPGESFFVLTEIYVFWSDRSARRLFAVVFWRRFFWRLCSYSSRSSSILPPNRF